MLMTRLEPVDEDSIPTRKSLLGRLKDWEDQESWHTFFDTYWKLIYRFALKRGLCHEEAQEVLQETVVAVAKSIREFQYDPHVCAFKTWLLSVTRNKIANQFARRARHDASVSALAAESAAAPACGEPSNDDWDQRWDEEWRDNLMETAVRRVRARVSIEQFQVFDLFVLKHYSASEVARTLGLSLGSVYVAKHRVSRLIRKELQTLETSRPLP